MARWTSDRFDAPLLAWDEALRTARAGRHQLARRAGLLGAGLALGLTIVVPPAPRLVWNASASAPIGLYSVRPGAPIERGDMVVARVPERFRLLAATRHYLPANVPLVKHVAAAAGDEVCARGPEIFVNGDRVAQRRGVDGMGRPMPWWRGCLRLREGQLFLLMAASPASFDGRYFGVTEAADVIGRARLLWAEPASSADHD